MADTGSSISTPVLVKVAVAGTREQLPTVGGKTACKSVIIQALSTNTEAVVIGDSTVVAKAGSQAVPEQRGIELKPSQSISLDLVDTASVFVDSRTSKDGIVVLVLNE